MRDREARGAAVRGVLKESGRLSDCTTRKVNKCGPSRNRSGAVAGSGLCFRGMAAVIGPVEEAGREVGGCWERGLRLDKTQGDQWMQTV